MQPKRLESLPQLPLRSSLVHFHILAYLNASCRLVAQRARAATPNRKAAEYVPEGPPGPYRGPRATGSYGRSGAAWHHHCNVRRGESLLGELPQWTGGIYREFIREGLKENLGSTPVLPSAPIPNNNFSALSSWVAARPAVRFGLMRLRRLRIADDLCAADWYGKLRSKEVMEADEGDTRVRKCEYVGREGKAYEIRRIADSRFVGRGNPEYFASTYFEGDRVRSGP